MLRGVQEESIEKGETIQADWEPWSEREAWLKEEAEARGDESHPESDYDIGERQAADYERAKQMAEKRKEKERQKERDRKKDTSREPALSFNPNKTGAGTGTGGSNRYWNDSDRKPWARTIGQNERDQREEQDKRERAILPAKETRRVGPSPSRRSTSPLRNEKKKKQ